MTDEVSTIYLGELFCTTYLDPSAENCEKCGYNWGSEHRSRVTTRNITLSFPSGLLETYRSPAQQQTVVCFSLLQWSSCPAQKLGELTPSASQPWTVTLSPSLEFIIILATRLGQLCLMIRTVSPQFCNTFHHQQQESRWASSWWILHRCLPCPHRYWGSDSRNNLNLQLKKKSDTNIMLT